MKVAILEDEEPQAALVASVVRREGHACVLFNSGTKLLTKLRQETFDLLILDWNVPGLSGVEVAAWARQNLSPSPPILMITARSGAEDVVEGLNAGADDFIIKPVAAEVLVARVAALLRRAYPAERTTGAEIFGPFTFDPLALTAHWDGRDAQLTAKEYGLAVVFFRNLNRPLGRAYLLETVWGRNPDLATRTLDAHVSKIRTKLELRPQAGFKLAPVYSYGYRLESLMNYQD